MPKRAQELSARTVGALKTQGRHAVGGVVGLCLRIKGGSRSWILRVKVCGRRRELGLGSFPEVSLAAARDLAWARRRSGSAVPQAVAEPVLPATAPPASTVSDAHRGTAPARTTDRTFEFCSRAYVAAQAPGWKSEKHAKQWLSTLETYAFPEIGGLDVGSIGADHVLGILRPIWCDKTETATRLRGRIEVILDWARHKGYRAGSNPASWEGNLKHELPSPTKLKKRKKQHHPALPYTRVGQFMADLRLRSGSSARALEWGILTAGRFQEISGARRSEVDVQLRRWTIPARRMKLEKEHVVPLSDAAIALYKSLPVMEGCDLLFPSPEGGELSDSALGAVIDMLHEHDINSGGSGYLDTKQGRVATQHGFRSTFRDWAAEVVVFPKDVIEHALAHKLKDEAEAAYQRGELLLKRARLMHEWANFCGEPVFEIPSLDRALKRD